MSQPAIEAATPLSPPLPGASFRSPVHAAESHARSPFFAAPPAHTANPARPPKTAENNGATVSVSPTSSSSASAAAPKASTIPLTANGRHSHTVDALASQAVKPPHYSIHGDLSFESSNKLKADPQTEFSIQRKPQDRQPSLMREAQTSQEEAIQHAHRQQYQHQQHQQHQNALLQQHCEERDAFVADAFRAARESDHQKWIVLMDLSRFASQHHMSAYSIIKFGPRGSPFAYVPITLQRPDAVEQTMRQQRESERDAVDWLISKKRKRGIQLRQQQHSGAVLKLLPQDMNCGPPSSVVGTKRSASVITPPNARATSLHRTRSTEANGHLVMEDQLSQAMSDSIRNGIAQSDASSSAESLVLDQDESKINELDRSTRLVEIKDGMEEAGWSASASHSSPHSDVRAEGGSVHSAQADGTAFEAGSSVMVDGPLTKQEIYVQDIEEASATRKPAHVPTEQQQQAHPPPVASMLPSQQANLAIKTSDTHPIHISPIIPENLLQEISDRILAAAPPQFIGNFDDKGDHQEREDRIHQPVSSFIDPAVHEREQAHGRRLLRLPQVVDLVAISTPAEPGVQSQAQIADQATAEANAAAASTSKPLPLTAQSTPPSDAVGTASMASQRRRRPCIGNLLLSSCPGKKVRLSGPVRGRGAICRDLGLDLKRIYSLGIRAVVCCLDNEELAYLGAPWQDYEREADALGLDVVRLPMAEGFAPTCVTRMDDAMTALIQDYTLRGKSVLVHCRGGVGRAGLSACLWMLKLGLVGPSPHAMHLDAMHSSPSSALGTVSHRSTQADGKQTIAETRMTALSTSSQSQTVLDTVERLIETIRRRRSPKAIETAEQVKFMVEFVTYLHRQEDLVRQNQC